MMEEVFPGVGEGGGTSVKETVVVPVYVPRVTTRTFPGPASHQNSHAIHWGSHGLLAYGCNYTVVVVDTVNVQVIQCLDRHKSIVRRVLWAPYRPQKQRSPGLCGSLQLVSADATGHIIVWDVCTGKPLAVLIDSTKPILQISWVDDREDVLVALQPLYSLVLWDIRKGTKLWCKTYTEPLLSFSFDPFHPGKMAFQCSDCVLFVDDFSVDRAPSSNGRKLYITAARTPSVAAPVSADITSLKRLIKDIEGIVIKETKPKSSEEMVSGGECLELSYHRSLRHHLLLLYPRELLILDLHVNCTVAVVPLGDKTSSPFIQAVSCRQRDVVYCLHDSGSVSVKTRRRPVSTCTATQPTHSYSSHSLSSLDVVSSGSSSSGSSAAGAVTSSGVDANVDMVYDGRCTSEAMRQVRGLHILGMAVSPVCERRIAVYLNSGKIALLEVQTTGGSGNGNKTVTITVDGITEPVCDTLSDLLPPLFTEGDNLSMSAVVRGVVAGMTSALTAMRMCPPITKRNIHSYTPLLAGGTAHGVLYLFNVVTGELEREFLIHSCPIRGIEWAGQKSVLSFGYPPGGRNEMFVTDVRTGESNAVRTDRGEEPPVCTVKVSPHKQYFVIVLEGGGGVELWDLNTRHMLRSLSSKIPTVVALEWSPSHYTRNMKRRQSSKEDCLLDASTPTGSAPPPPKLERLESAAVITAREHLVFCDTNSQLYHFTVEGHKLTDGMRIPPEGGGGSVKCLAIKADLIVQGHADGLLSVWDLRLNQARSHITGRGCISKMKFAPGKGNLKLLLLYNDGVDIIALESAPPKGDKGGFEKCASLRCPRDMVKVMDIDWSGSDRPILSTADCCLRIMDITLSTATSTLLDYEFICNIGCAALLPPAVAFKLRELLCWQPPDKLYTLALTEDDGFTAGQLDRVHEVLDQMEPSVKSALMAPELGTAERCLLTARLFGDLTEIDFWTVAIYYLRVSKGDGGELVPLDTCYDVVQDETSYGRVQKERLSLQELRQTRATPDYQHTRHVIQQLILLGHTDRAVQLLLETDIAHSNYYMDAFKACLVATARDSQAAQSTIKLVATNLIAGGAIWDGVQLLCLIGKGVDACRYLQSYGHWGAATWLARAILPPSDASQVLRKWSDHLISQGYKEKAILVLMSIEDWPSAYALVASINPSRAAHLVHAFQDFNISDLLINCQLMRSR